MAASSEEKLGVSTTCVNRAIAPRPVPSPNRAVTIGRPIAVSEPNVSSSTTIAASSPTAVETPKPTCSVASIACPPSSTWSPGRAAARATCTTRSGALFGSRLAFSSNTTVANAILPLADTDLPLPAPAYGLITLVTCGSCATCANIALMRARTAGSRTLPELTL